jgi:hypothetical protein
MPCWDVLGQHSSCQQLGLLQMPCEHLLHARLCHQRAQLHCVQGRDVLNYAWCIQDQFVPTQGTGSCTGITHVCKDECRKDILLGIRHGWSPGIRGRGQPLHPRKGPRPVVLSSHGNYRWGPLVRAAVQRVRPMLGQR